MASDNSVYYDVTEYGAVRVRELTKARDNSVKLEDTYGACRIYAVSHPLDGGWSKSVSMYVVYSKTAFLLPTELFSISCADVFATSTLILVMLNRYMQ